MRMQRCFRRSQLQGALHEVMRRVRQVRRRRHAATVIQAAARGWADRRTLNQLRARPVRLQALFRGLKSR